MSKYLARLAAAAILATGIFAGGSGPANAAPEGHLNIATTDVYDTGWG